MLKGGQIYAAEECLRPFIGAAVLVETRLLLARVALVQGDFEHALALLVQAEAQHSMDRRIWRALADVHQLRQQPAQELEYRRKLVYLDGGAPATAYTALVNAFIRAHYGNRTAPAAELKIASAKLSAIPDVTSADKMEFACALYQVDALAVEARAHYQGANPCPREARDVAVPWVRMLDWCERSGASLHRLGQDGRPGHRPMVAELTDVSVFPSFQWIPVLAGGAAALDGFMMHRLRLQAEEPLSPILMGSKRYAELRLPKQLPVIDEPALLIGGMAQYYHQTVDFLGSLAVADTLGQGRGLRLVVNDDLAPFQLEQFALLGYSLDRLIRVKPEQPVLLRQAIVPSRLVLGGRWIDPILPRWHRERLRRAVAGVPSIAGRKLYLSRQGAVRRRVVNEEAVQALLESLGFEIVHPERLGVREQINLFSSASHIVGPTGAALTNMVYAPAGALIVVFYSRHLVAGGGDLYFDALAAACEHRFVRLEGTPTGTQQGQRVIDADIAIDLEELRVALV